MKPFIYKFKTDRFNYIYDINSNRVFQVSETTWTIIDDYDDCTIAQLSSMYPKFAKSELAESYGEIAAARKDLNAFPVHRPSKMSYDDKLSIEEMLEAFPNEQLILNITESCNLRCKYCIYSGAYQGQRKHNAKTMSFASARKALNRFLKSSKDEVHISFYGGEPLLAFNLIKQIIEYAEPTTTKQIHWSMTTNATLMTPEIAEYLLQKQFLLTVSLDGPREIHDRYRVYPNGKGTFTKIIKNLTYLHSLDEEYFKSNVIFSIVCAPPVRLPLINDFFAGHPLFKNNYVFISYMNWTIDNFAYTPTQKDYQILARDRHNLLIQYATQAIPSDTKDKVLLALYEKDLVNFYHRSKERLGDTIRPNGCCIPSARRLFLSTDDILYGCEKIDSAYPIGTLDNWVEHNKVKKLVDDYLEISKDCLNCWACRLCIACFANFIAYGRLDAEHRLKHCEAMKIHLHKMLVFYYEMLEENIASFDHLSERSFT